MKKWILSLAFFLVLGIFFQAVQFPERASAAEIQWGPVQKGVYEDLHPFTLLWSGNIMQDGGLNLRTMEITDDSSEADIIINQYGDMGANGILQLEEDLEDPTDSDLYGFTNSVEIEKGAVYLVILHDGTYAKIRIDRFLPEKGISITKVFFSYVLEDTGSDNEDNSGDDDDYYGEDDFGDFDDSYGEDDFGNFDDYLDDNDSSPITVDLGDPKEDLNQAEATYEFFEGDVLLPWNAFDDHVAWDLYRSDNGEPYVKMNDFILTVPEYTDKYVLAGHTYVYKFVAYNSNEEPVFVSPPVVVKIISEDGESPSGSSSGAESTIILQIGSKKATANGKTYTLDVAPFIKDERTMVPLRFISEALGAKVEWNGKERSITLTRGSEKMILKIDSSVATVNGKTVYMDVPATIHNDTTMVPIRFVSENFKLEIEFDSNTRTITIKGRSASGGGQPEQNNSGTGNSSSSQNQNSSQNKSQPNQSSNASTDYFIGKWSMWIPGTGISTGEGGKYIPGADAGILTIYEDGTYTYTWNGKLITSNWEPGSDDTHIYLLNYKFDSDWKLTKTGDGVRARTDPGLIEDGTRVE